MPADRFIAHGSRAGQLAECGIDEAGIAAAVSEALNLQRRRPVIESRVARRTISMPAAPAILTPRTGNPTPRGDL